MTYVPTSWSLPKKLAMEKLVSCQLHAPVCKQPEIGNSSLFFISRGEQINFLKLHSWMLPDSTTQQKAPTHAKNHQCNKSSTQAGIHDIPKQYSFPQKLPQIRTPTCYPPAMPIASQWHFAALSHWHSVTALALQTLRAHVCTGTAPTNWGFGFIGLFCLGSGETKHQVFL